MPVLLVIIMFPKLPPHAREGGGPIDDGAPPETAGASFLLKKLGSPRYESDMLVMPCDSVGSGIFAFRSSSALIATPPDAAGRARVARPGDCLGTSFLAAGLEARAAAASAAADAAASGAPDAEAPAFRLSRTRLARLEAMETSDGLGLRGLGVAASRTGTLASLTATAAPVGAAATLVPVVGPVLAASLAALVASYALSWELLDPYFDKKGFGYEQQDKIMWANRFALCAFAAPFTVALAVPLFGPLAAAVAQGAAGTALWRVLEPDDEGDEGGD